MRYDDRSRLFLSSIMLPLERVQFMYRHFTHERHETREVYSDLGYRKIEITVPYAWIHAYRRISSSRESKHVSDLLACLSSLLLCLTPSRKIDLNTPSLYTSRHPNAESPFVRSTHHLTRVLTVKTVYLLIRSKVFLNDIRCWSKSYRYVSGKTLQV